MSTLRLKFSEKAAVSVDQVRALTAQVVEEIGGGSALATASTAAWV